MNDVRKGTVLALEEDAGVDHDIHEEPRLTLSEAER